MQQLWRCAVTGMTPALPHFLNRPLQILEMRIVADIGKNRELCADTFSKLLPHVLVDVEERLVVATCASNSSKQVPRDEVAILCTQARIREQLEQLSDHLQESR